MSTLQLPQASAPLARVEPAGSVSSRNSSQTNLAGASSCGSMPDAWEELETAAGDGLVGTFPMATNDGITRSPAKHHRRAAASTPHCFGSDPLAAEVR